MKRQKASFTRSLAFAVILAAVLAAFFANKKAEPRGVVSNVEPAEVMVGSISFGAKENSSKFNHYIECMNRQSKRAYDSYNRYLSWVNKETGPIGNEKVVYGLYTLYDIESCEAGIRDAAGMAPKEPELQTLAGGFLSALSTLSVVIEEADRYYDQKDYLDDKMKKGKILHIKLMDAFTAFIEIDQKLRHKINQEKGEANATIIQEWNQKGVKGELLVEETVTLSRELCEMTWNKPLVSIELEPLTKAVDLLEAKTNALEKISQSTTIKWSINTYLDKCQRMLKAAKALKRRVRDNKPYNNSEEIRLKHAASWTVEGSPFQLRRTFNDLARVFNQLELEPKPVQSLFIPNYQTEAVNL
ncbi:YiiG family protein [bacterium]|nr:YiiG family protein [bacterium]